MYGMENAPNSHLRWNSFTTTGNKSEQSFDALTVVEGGRGMEMEKVEWSFSCESSEGQTLR